MLFHREKLYLRIYLFNCLNFFTDLLLKKNLLNIFTVFYYFFLDSHSAYVCCYCCYSVAKSCLTLQLHGLQHTRLPCPLLSPRVCSNSYPLSWWFYLTISSSAALFFCPQSFPASGSLPMSQLITSGSQIIGASPSVLPRIFRVYFL